MKNNTNENCSTLFCVISKNLNKNSQIFPNWNNLKCIRWVNALIFAFVKPQNASLSPRKIQYSNNNTLLQKKSAIFYIEVQTIWSITNHFAITGENYTMLLHENLVCKESYQNFSSFVRKGYNNYFLLLLAFMLL